MTHIVCPMCYTHTHNDGFPCSVCNPYPCDEKYTYSWEYKECHECKFWDCCRGLDELRKHEFGIWEARCSSFERRD